MLPNLKEIEVNFFDKTPTSADYWCSYLSQPQFYNLKYISLSPLVMTTEQIESVISTKNPKKMFRFK
jgi:hypothetical protein